MTIKMPWSCTVVTLFITCPIIHSDWPSKISKAIAFNFSCKSQDKVKTMVEQNFWGTNEVYHFLFVRGLFLLNYLSTKLKGINLSIRTQVCIADLFFKCLILLDFFFNSSFKNTEKRSNFLET